MFRLLPEEIFYLLQTYLSHEEYRNILNSSKKNYWKELKRKSCCYYLNGKYSKEFFYPVKYPDFKQRLLSLVSDQQKQIGINYDRNFFCDEDVIPVSELSNFCSATVRNGKGTAISSLPNLALFYATQRLIISDCQAIQRLDGLSLIRCLSITGFSNLIDISPLSTCRYLDTVDISTCKYLTDINALAHVKDIHILSCPISDKGIADLGASIHNLHLSFINNVTSIDHISGLKSICLSSCNNIISINRLLLLKQLVVWNCRNFISYSDLPSLKKIDFNGCENFDFKKVNTVVVHERQLQACSVVEMYVDGSLGIPIELPRLLSFEQLEILKLSFCGRFVIGMNLLASLSCLRRLDISEFTDPEFDIHVFQQVTWLSVGNSDNCQGIVRSMPNLRTVVFCKCPNMTTIIGLTGNTKMKVKVKKCPLFVPTKDFIQLLVESIDMLSYDSHSRSNLPSSIQLPQDDQIIFMENEKRDKVIQFTKSIPFDILLLACIFRTLHVLVLDNFQKLTNLSSFIPAGIHKIPILYISHANDLTSLYPLHIQPQHERLVLESCPNLVDISSIGSIPVISIFCCTKLKDFRPLQGCQKIFYNQGFLPRTSAVYDQTLFSQLEDRIEPFSYANTFEKLLSVFEIDMNC